MPNAARGHFIALEGGEGTGKSTQCAALARRIRNAGFKVVETREPGGTPGAEAIRHLLKSGVLEKLGPAAETVMISAARADHVDCVIRPALEAGSWVVCDRFADSTRAYQGKGAGVSEELITALERVSMGDTRPDLVIVLDAPVEVGMQRASERGETQTTPPDRFERESLAYHRKLRAAFRDIVKNDPQHHVLIDATQAPEHVEEAIWSNVKSRLGAALQPPRREPVAGTQAEDTNE